jgi:hypothetical protein
MFNFKKYFYEHLKDTDERRACEGGSLPSAVSVSVPVNVPAILDIIENSTLKAEADSDF